MSNDSQIPFSPLGNSVLVRADVAAPVGVQVPVFTKFNAQNVGQYRIVNNSPTTTVYLGVGTTASAAQTNSAAPIVGTPSPAIVLAPGAVEILRFSPDAYFSGTAIAPADVFIVPGQGI